mmetsp:Transcript_107343/g.341966  ORF Transcript_107343/g.341966 Transcript_107343/m.341966 type:complete len:234 (-) Transcript_107343:1296-1997(-)
MTGRRIPSSRPISPTRGNAAVQAGLGRAAAAPCQEPGTSRTAIWRSIPLTGGLAAPVGRGGAAAGDPCRMAGSSRTMTGRRPAPPARGGPTGPARRGRATAAAVRRTRSPPGCSACRVPMSRPQRRRYCRENPTHSGLPGCLPTTSAWMAAPPLQLEEPLRRCSWKRACRSWAEGRPQVRGCCSRRPSSPTPLTRKRCSALACTSRLLISPSGWCAGWTRPSNAFPVMRSRGC